MNSAAKERLVSHTLIPSLQAETQFFLREIAARYEMTPDDLRDLAKSARDLEMWRETPLPEWWVEVEAGPDPRDPNCKDRMLCLLDEHMDALRAAEKIYPTDPLRGQAVVRPKIIDRPSPTPVFGLCPSFSKYTNCCGLFTIDAVTGCALGCSFCPVNAFYGEKVEFSVDLAQQLEALEVDPQRFYHVSTGQIADSLIWGNRQGILDALIGLAERHPNILLELKTRSDNIEYLLHRKLPPNLLCTWYLNTETVIRNEEHGTAPLQRRIQAARLMADRGCRIGFHVHPMVYYQGWRSEYASLGAMIMAKFSPDQVDLISLAVMSFTPSVIRNIRRRGGETKALQMPLVADPEGKLTYPAKRRIEMYDVLYTTLQPWRDRVFIYLCMETDSVWEAVLGKVVPIKRRLEQITGWQPPAASAEVA